MEFFFSDTTVELVVDKHLEKSVRWPQFGSTIDGFCLFMLGFLIPLKDFNATLNLKNSAVKEITINLLVGLLWSVLSG